MQQDQQNQKKCNLQLIPQNSIRIKKYCKGMAINKENSLLLIDSLYFIAVYAFKNGSINKLQLLQSRSSAHATSTFLNKKSYFISSSQNSLILWSTTLLGSYKYIKKLEEHQNTIFCIALHPINENLIFSSSQDGDIKIWSISSKKNPCKQTISATIGKIIQLLINQEGDKLIVLGDNKKILILQQNGTQWDNKYQVEYNQEINKICFMNNNSFCFSSKQMVLFSHLAQNLQISYIQEETINFYFSENLLINECIHFFKSDTFPFFYDQNKQVLLIVGVCNLYIIKYQNIESGKLIIDQVIKYRDVQQSSSFIIAFMSKDGKYLMISDLKSFQIDIFELQDLY
ncbi:unnamed protein product [Paramecium pentaurelia]|uniref:WD40-repeat-containing domain n=1 Tax=Paramecium pentaurelia TaxID=43138 RepID=A0A8S1X4C4_9CILI|nr:unnamed protein product [Paramecium pentaurelia]